MATSEVSCGSQSDQYISVTSFPVGYISSEMVTVGCKGVARAWLIEANKGQTIEVRLFDFNIARKATQTDSGDTRCKVLLAHLWTFICEMCRA